VNSTLSTEQNESMREAARRLVARCGGNVSEAARLLDVNQSGLARFLAGSQGTSYATAALIARELREDLNKLLGLAFVAPKRLRELPGYQRSLIEARLSGIYTDETWDAVGEYVLQPHPEEITTQFMNDMAVVVHHMRVKKLTSSGDTLPPSRPGGHRRSGGKIRTR
jgi:hypothetical protein